MSPATSEMLRRFALVIGVAWLGTSLAGCGGATSSGCGPGTKLSPDGVCVAGSSANPPRSPLCGSGTVEDAGRCVLATPSPVPDGGPQERDSGALASRVTTWPTGHLPEFYLELGGQAREDFDAARAVLARCRLGVAAGQS